MRDCVGWYYCEMVSYLRVVKDAFVRSDPVLVEDSAREWIFELAQRRFHGRHVILRQCARICARVGDSFMSLVERLRDLQSALRGKTEAAVGFTLQAREIIQLRRDLGAGLFFLQLNDAFFAEALALNRLGDFTMPQSGGSAVFFPEGSARGTKLLLGLRQT